MAYDKLYDPTSWVDKQAPGISAANLNKLAKAVSKMDDRIIEMEAATSEKTSIVDKQITALQEASEAHTEGLTDAVNRIEEVEKVQGTMSEDVAQIASTLDTLSRTTSPAITETAIGTSVCVKDTAADGYVDILAHGKYEQDGEPTPNNPIEIKKSVVSEVETHRKNHLDCRGLSEFVSTGFTFTPVYDANGTLLYINVNGTWDTSSTASNVRMKIGTWYPKEVGSYILNGSPNLGDNTYIALDKNGNAGAYEVYGVGDKVFEVAEDVEFYDVYIRIESGLTINNEKFYPMIRKADIEDATYEPYTESVAILSNTIELGGIGDVADTMDAKETKRRFAETRITGDNVEAFFESATYGNYFTLNIKGKAEGKCISTHFIGIEFADRTKNPEAYRCFIDGAQNVTLRVSASANSTYSDADSMKAYLDANEVYVAYELAEPTTEALPTADQIALHSLKSFDGVTYVETDSEVKPTIEVKCVLDTKAYIDRKFAELQTALSAE